MSVRHFMELPNDAISRAIWVGVIVLFRPRLWIARLWWAVLGLPRRFFSLRNRGRPVESVPHR
jgi:hypothetical protein